MEELAWNFTLEMLWISWNMRTSVGAMFPGVSCFMPYICRGATSWILNSRDEQLGQIPHAGLSKFSHDKSLMTGPSWRMLLLTKPRHSHLTTFRNNSIVYTHCNIQWLWLSVHIFMFLWSMMSPLARILNWALSRHVWLLLGLFFLSFIPPEDTSDPSAGFIVTVFTVFRN